MTCSLAHLLARSLVPFLAYLCTFPPLYLLGHSLTRSLTCLLTFIPTSFAHLLARSLAYLPAFLHFFFASTDSLARSLARSLAQLLALPPTFPPFYSVAHLLARLSACLPTHIHPYLFISSPTCSLSRLLAYLSSQPLCFVARTLTYSLGRSLHCLSTYLSFPFTCSLTCSLACSIAYLHTCMHLYLIAHLLRHLYSLGYVFSLSLPVFFAGIFSGHSPCSLRVPNAPRSPLTRGGAQRAWRSGSLAARSGSPIVPSRSQRWSPRFRAHALESHSPSCRLL